MKKTLLLCTAYILISGSFSQYEQFPPSFINPPSIASVNEGNYRDNPKFLFNLTATLRSPILTVTISVEAPSSDTVYVNFTQTANKAYGQVYVKAELDRERASEEQLNFTARSSKSTAPPTTLSITLYIDDINAESPVFSAPAYQVTIPENYSVNTAVQDLNSLAIDPDMGLGGQVQYSIEAAELYKGYFTIHTGYNGTYLFLSKELDYETLTFLQYKIIAMDGAPPYHTSTAELLVKVQDVQDKPPTHPGLPYIKNVTENVTGATFNVTAVDGDLGIPRPVNHGLINKTRCRRPYLSKKLNITNYKETYRYNEEIHFRCESGLPLRGITTAVCGDFNRFNITMLPTCEDALIMKPFTASTITIGASVGGSVALLLLLFGMVICLRKHRAKECNYEKTNIALKEQHHYTDIIHHQTREPAHDSEPVYMSIIDEGVSSPSRN